MFTTWKQGFWVSLKVVTEMVGGVWISVSRSAGHRRWECPWTLDMEFRMEARALSQQFFREKWTSSLWFYTSLSRKFFSCSHQRFQIRCSDCSVWKLPRETVIQMSLVTAPSETPMGHPFKFTGNPRILGSVFFFWTELLVLYLLYYQSPFSGLQVAFPPKKSFPRWFLRWCPFLLSCHVAATSFDNDNSFLSETLFQGKLYNRNWINESDNVVFKMSLYL